MFLSILNFLLRYKETQPQKLAYCQLNSQLEQEEALTYEALYHKVGLASAT